MFVKLEKDKIIHLVDITASSPDINNSILIKWKITPIFYSSRDKNFGGSTRSYIIPTPSNIRGLLMSILGLKRKEMIKFIESYKIKVGFWIDLSKAYRITVTHNFIKELSSNDWSKRAQVSREVIYLKDSNIEIYFLIDKENEDLIRKLINKEFAFIPYLGLSNFLFSIEESKVVDSYNIVKNNEDVLKSKIIHVEIVPTKVVSTGRKEILKTEPYYIIN